MSILKNDGIHGSTNDQWITPKEIIQCLGPFDLDPCAAPKMPWRTAKKMWSEKGLDRPWTGRVWCNPPYSRVMPWAHRMVENGSGIMLVSNKSADTQWYHLLLKACHSIFVMEGRISFCYPDGSTSTGAFLSSVFFAMTFEDTRRFEYLYKFYRGQILKVTS